MLHAHAADFVVVRNALLFGEIADDLGLLGALDILVRYVMVGYECDLGRIEYRTGADLLELLDGDRRGYIVGKHQIEIAFDELTGLDLFEPGVGGQDLLCHSHGTCHCEPLLIYRGNSIIVPSQTRRAPMRPFSQ